MNLLAPGSTGTHAGSIALCLRSIMSVHVLKVNLKFQFGTMLKIFKAKYLFVDSLAQINYISQ